MKFTKLRKGVSAEWKAITDKGDYFITKSTTPNLGIVSYEVSVDLIDGSSKILAYDLQYLREAKQMAVNFQNI